MKYNYAFDKEKENMVKVIGRDLNISTKQAIEMCSFIKGMPLKKARALLEKVEKKQLAIPFKRFTQGAGHKKGMSAGKYPVRASRQFLKLLKAVEANAQNKGLSSELKIIHACAQQAARPVHYGRKRGIKMKRTHVELVAEEMELVKKKEAKKAEVKKKPVKELEEKKLEEKKVEEKKGEEKPAEKKKEPEAKKALKKKSEIKEKQGKENLVASGAKKEEKKVEDKK